MSKKTPYKEVKLLFEKFSSKIPITLEEAEKIQGSDYAIFNIKMVGENEMGTYFFTPAELVEKQRKLTNSKS